MPRGDAAADMLLPPRPPNPPPSTDAFDPDPPAKRPRARASSGPVANRSRRTNAAAPRTVRAWRATWLGLALAFGGQHGTAFAVEPLQQHDIVLLQPGAVIERRVAGGADAMADYLRRLGIAATDTLRDNPRQIPSAGFIVVAVRPAGQVHTWYDFKPALADATTSALDAALASVPPVPVKEAEVVFALRVSVWGAKPPAGYAPAPQAWRDAAKQAGRKLDIDALVDRVWPVGP